MIKIKITKDMMIMEIMERFPGKAQQLAAELNNSGLHCAGCMGSSFETLEQGILGHGMSRKKLDEVVNKLNKIVGKKGK